MQGGGTWVNCRGTRLNWGSARQSDQKQGSNASKILFTRRQEKKGAAIGDLFRFVDFGRLSREGHVLGGPSTKSEAQGAEARQYHRPGCGFRDGRRESAAGDFVVHADHVELDVVGFIVGFRAMVGK